MSTITAVPASVKRMFASDERIVTVVRYDDGFVPNSYRYRCPGTATVFHRDGRIEEREYDRKRSYGIGPRMVGFSERGGRLASC